MKPLNQENTPFWVYYPNFSGLPWQKQGSCASYRIPLCQTLTPHWIKLLGDQWRFRTTNNAFWFDLVAHWETEIWSGIYRCGGGVFSSWHSDVLWFQFTSNWQHLVHHWRGAYYWSIKNNIFFRPPDKDKTHAFLLWRHHPHFDQTLLHRIWCWVHWNFVSLWRFLRDNCAVPKVLPYYWAYFETPCHRTLHQSRGWFGYLACVSKN